MSFMGNQASDVRGISKAESSPQPSESASSLYSEYTTQSPSDTGTTDSIPRGDLDTFEKPGSTNATHTRREDSDTDSPVPGIRNDSPIEYLNLEFDTKIPTISPSKLPPSLTYPDLAPYTSPFLWSRARKTVNLILSVTVTCLSAAAAGAYNSPSEILMEKWGVSYVIYELGMMIYCIGFGFMPMLLAPFSELNGRRPMLLPSGLIMTVALIGCGVTESFAGMLVARFFVGVGASTFSSVICGVISDMYGTSERNTPMSVFAAASIFGTGLSPLVSGFITQRAPWPWVFYSQGIASGILLVALFFLLDESRGSVLLARKAAVLNKLYEKMETLGHFGVPVYSDPYFPEAGSHITRLRWKVRADEERESLGKMLSISLYRPFLPIEPDTAIRESTLLIEIDMLFTEPVVFFFSLWAAFSWAVLYLQFIAVPLVFQTIYGFNVEENGAVFSAMCIGSIIAVIVTILIYNYSAKRFPQRFEAPECRLYIVCVKTIFLPVGLFWFGWTCRANIHWISPVLAIGCLSVGSFSIYHAVFNYLADSYHRYASSASAAQSFCRNILGGVFPLVARPMFQNLGYSNASSLLGAIGCLLSLVPWVLVWKGPQIRARSKLAKELLEKPNTGS